MTFEEYWLLVLIVSARVTAFIAIMPLLRGSNIPMMAKTSIILSISAFVAYQLEPIQVQNLPELLGILILEVIIGFILAYIVELMFSIVRIAGSLIDLDIGLANPFSDGTTNSQATVISRIFYYVFILIFIVVGGVEQVISGFVYTFQLNFRTEVLSDPAFMSHIIETFNFMFFGALQIAIPFMMSTFLIYIALLLMSKSVDKINILMNIFGVKILVGVIMIAFCVPTLIIVFQQVNDLNTESFYELIRMMFSE